MVTVPRRISKKTAARFGWIRWVVAVGLVFSWIDASCEAQSQNVGTLHGGSAPGLTVSINTNWVSSNGYRPFRITIKSPRPVLSDRTLTFEVQHRNWWSGGASKRVIQDVMVPAGSKVVQATMSVPPGFTNLGISVSEDGKMLPKLYFSEGNPFSATGLSILCVGIDSETSFSALSQCPSVGDSLRYHLLDPVRDPGDLPTRWIDFTGVDLIWLHIDQLDSLSANQPETWKAIVDWTSAGGNLCVFGLGDDWQRLGELESLMKWLPEKMPNEKSSGIPTDRGWIEPKQNLLGIPLQGLESIQRPYMVEEPIFEPLEPDGEPTDPPTTPGHPPFLIRPFDAGMVVARASEEPFPKNANHWNWLLNTLTSKRWWWTQRHGLSLAQENPEFYQFLIPGVGLVPTTAFRVLITLFVLLIGPVNYILLRRWKRLHLLMVTIPVGAATVAVSLFLFALITDGLSTRVRIRSVTRIDQPSGRTSCWSRLSYYAGLASGEGMRFPDDVAIYPYEFRPFQESFRRLMIWEDEQYLASGWLPARTFIQYLTVRSRTTEHRLDIWPDDDSDTDRLAVRNRLGTRIEKLLVCDDKGEFYWGINIEPNTSAKVSRIEGPDIESQLKGLFAESVLHYPSEINPQDFNSDPFGTSWRWRYGYNSWTEDPTQGTGILETSIRSFASCPKGVPAMKPGSYLAIVERSPEVALGIDSAKEEGSFHIILGNWKP